MVGDGGADVAESIRKGLEAMTVGCDGEVTLDETSELRLMVNSPSHLIVQKHGDEHPCFLGGLILRHDYVQDFVGDGPIEPGPNDVFIASPVRRVVRRGSDDVDVREQVVPAEEDADEHPPLGEVRGMEVERDGHMSAHASDMHCRRGGGGHSSGDEGARGGVHG